MKNFIMNDTQEAQFKAWSEKQPKRHYRAAGDMGTSQFQFIFTETNVGVCLTVKNVDNDQELDLTDYDSF
jgi:hypothetical protein